jgi:multicomponent Na+:H+ antiporter subunit D
MINLVVLLIAVPLTSSFVPLIEKQFPRMRLTRFAAPASLAACFVFLVLLYPAVSRGDSLRYGLGEWPGFIRISLILDGPAWFGSLAVVLVTFPALLYAMGEGRYSPIFYFFFLVMIAALFAFLLTEDIFNMFVVLEILALCAYILIAYLKNPEAVLASFKYLMMSALSVTFFLFGVFVLYRMTGTLSLSEIGPRLRSSGTAVNGRAVAVALTCLLTGIGLRTAFVPYHFWLPDAHAFAPHPVSAVLSGVMIKAPFFALWRILRLLGIGDLHGILLWAGAVTAFLGVLWALAQNDVKKLLAYHSVSQIGYIVAAFGAGTGTALTASAYHILNHGVFKALLFLSVGTVVEATGERDIRHLGNLGKKLPFTALAFAVAAFSIAGVPPFNGFVSKQLISAGLSQSPAYFLVWLAGFGTAASFIKLSAMFRRKKTTLPEGVQNPVPPRKSLYPALFLLGFFCVLFGLAPAFWIDRLSALLGPFPPAPELSASPPAGIYTIGNILGAGAVAAVGILLYLAVSSSPGKALLTKVRRNGIGLQDSLLVILAALVLFAVLLMT